MSLKTPFDHRATHTKPNFLLNFAPCTIGTKNVSSQLPCTNIDPISMVIRTTNYSITKNLSVVNRDSHLCLHLGLRGSIQNFDPLNLTSEWRPCRQQINPLGRFRKTLLHKVGSVIGVLVSLNVRTLTSVTLSH